MNLNSHSNESICLDKNCSLEHEKCTDIKCLEKNNLSTIDITFLNENESLNEMQNDIPASLDSLGKNILSQTNIEVSITEHLQKAEPSENFG